MLRTLDKVYFRIKDAIHLLQGKESLIDIYTEGVTAGYQIALGEVRRTLQLHDPSDFSNNHFKLGYYYAAEQAKKVMQIDEDNLVD